MCCKEETSFRQVPKQASSIAAAFLYCLALSRFICSVNSLICPLIILPSVLPMLAHRPLHSLLPDRINLISKSRSVDPISNSRAIPNFRLVVKYSNRQLPLHSHPCLQQFASDLGLRRSLLILIAVPFQQQGFYRPRNPSSAS